MQNGFRNHLSVLENQGQVAKALHSNLEQYSANVIVVFGKGSVSICTLGICLLLIYKKSRVVAALLHASYTIHGINLKKIYIWKITCIQESNSFQEHKPFSCIQLITMKENNN